MILSVKSEGRRGSDEQWMPILAAPPPIKGTCTKRSGPVGFSLRGSNVEREEPFDLLKQTEPTQNPEELKGRKRSIR